MRRSALAAALVLVLAGCAAIEYRPDRERTVYLAAKDSVYCLWRTGAVTLEDLQRARPTLEAVHAALSAQSEDEPDASVREFLFAQIDLHADERDRGLLRELVSAALEDFAVDENALAGRWRRTVLLILGGVIDAVGYVESVAGEGSG